MKRTLSLKRETLAELAVEDLRGVVGGAPPSLANIRDCVPSMDYSCINCITHTGCLTP